VRRALVTGGSSAIGAAICRDLASDAASYVSGEVISVAGEMYS